jgi:hypothetical protein
MAFAQQLFGHQFGTWTVLATQKAGHGGLAGKWRGCKRGTGHLGFVTQSIVQGHRFAWGFAHGAILLSIRKVRLWHQANEWQVALTHAKRLSTV